MEPSNTTVVISCYKRSTEWADKLTALGFDVRRYTKEDPTSQYNVERNVGAEATAYLKYCIDSYENFSEYTIFLHDEEFSWHHEGSIIERIQECIGWSGVYRTLNNAHNLPWLYWEDNRNNSAYKFYNDFLKEYLGPIEIYGEFLGPDAVGAAQMIVHKDAILLRPYEMYFKIYWRLLRSADLPGAVKDLGIMMEYFWGIIFSETRPIDWSKADKICVTCKEPFPYRSLYSYQAIDFFLGVDPPSDLKSKYKWLIHFNEPKHNYNFDMLYTRLRKFFSTHTYINQSFLFQDDILSKYFNYEPIILHYIR